MSEAENPAAFPMSLEIGKQSPHGGMSLRDWFAGQALAGGMAVYGTYDGWAGAARDAYEAADAMLAERAKADPRS